MRTILYVLVILMMAIFLMSCAAAKPVVHKEKPSHPVYVADIEEIEGQEREPVDRSNTVTTPKGFIYYDDPPRKISEAPLRYPKFAKDAGIQGCVELEIEVLTNGRVGAIDVVKSVLPGPGGLDEAAIEYARKLRFEPAKTNGNINRYYFLVC